MRAERGPGVAEEMLEARAQIVQPGLAVGRVAEPVLRASAVAREPHVALAAVPRKGVELVLPERPLLRRLHQLDHRLGVDVAEQVIGLDEVVARIQVAVVLERERVAACRRVDAQAVRPRCDPSVTSNICTKTVPTSRRIHSSNTADEEVAVLLGPDRALGDQRSRLRVEQPPAAGRVAPPCVRQLERLLGGALDDRDELEVASCRARRGRTGTPRAGGPRWRRARAQDVDFDVVRAQELHAAHHVVEAAAARSSRRGRRRASRAARRC